MSRDSTSVISAGCQRWKRYFLYVELEEEDGGTLARKVGEAVTNTIGVVVTAIDIPLGEYELNRGLLCKKSK